jgi:hypothetical protein
MISKPGFWLRSRASGDASVAKKPGFQGRSRASSWVSCRTVAAVLALLVCASAAPAARYGNVEVIVESEPRGAATHGYGEAWVRVKNHSEQTAYTVRLTFPKSSSSPGADYLRAVTRTVTVEPGKVARVAIAYPERLALGGNGLGVAVDGREHDEPVMLGGSSHGYTPRGAFTTFGGYGSPRPLVYFSRSVDTRFPDWVQQTQLRIAMDARDPAAPGGGFVPLGLNTAECVRADLPATSWGPNWLGYSRYDGVVVTAEDLRAMPAEARGALGQYVECGGSLLVLGADPPLPGRWKPQRVGVLPLSAGTAGLGDYFVIDRLDLSEWESGAASPVFESWNRTLGPLGRNATPAEAHRVFPVIDDVGVPVKGLLALMLVFALVIGPINLFVLARRKRKLWQFWTVPLVSLVTCVGVFAYMAATEGWQGRVRTEGFTVLDENTRRAATIGWTGYYTPLLSGSGLHFSTGTEVAYQNSDDRASGAYYTRRRGGVSALTIDWTGDQHLTSGWVTPRVPAHFAVRKGETRRERVTIGRGADGRPEATNGLGADLTELWYADEKGALYWTGPIPAGGRAALDPAHATRTAHGTRSLRDVYAGEWHNVAARMKADGPALLTPRTYLAVMDAAPFLDDAVPRASVRKVRSVVLGILREGGDEG